MASQNLRNTQRLGIILLIYTLFNYGTAQLSFCSEDAYYKLYTR